MRKFGLVAAATLALLGTAAHAKTTIVYAGRVITEAGKAAQGPSTITITDDRITAIAPGRTDPPAGAEVVDLGDEVSQTADVDHCCPQILVGYVGALCEQPAAPSSSVETTQIGRSSPAPNQKSGRQPLRGGGH